MSSASAANASSAACGKLNDVTAGSNRLATGAESVATSNLVELSELQSALNAEDDDGDLHLAFAEGDVPVAPDATRFPIEAKLLEMFADVRQRLHKAGLQELSLSAPIRIEERKGVNGVCHMTRGEATFSADGTKRFETNNVKWIGIRLRSEQTNELICAHAS